MLQNFVLLSQKCQMYSLIKKIRFRGIFQVACSKLSYVNLSPFPKHNQNGHAV